MVKFSGLISSPLDIHVAKFSREILTSIKLRVYNCLSKLLCTYRLSLINMWSCGFADMQYIGWIETSSCYLLPFQLQCVKELLSKLESSSAEQAGKPCLERCVVVVVLALAVVSHMTPICTNYVLCMV